MLGKTKHFLQKKRVHIDAVHDMVEMKIGNAEMAFPYDVALELSVKMRMAGKRAKRNAGDNSKIMRVSGDLTDANNKPISHQAFKLVKPSRGS